MNIVLLVADTLRLKEISNGEVDFLKDLDKTSSENYYANAPWTVPAHASMFTGKLPSEHGVTAENPYFDKRNILLEEVEEENYSTYAVSENKLLSQVTGFSADFDEFENTNEDSWDGENWQKFISNNKSGIKDYARFGLNSVLDADFDSIKSLFAYLRKKKESTEEFNPTYTGFTLSRVKQKISSDGDSFVLANLMPTHLPYTFTEKERDEFLSDMDDEEIKRLSKGGSSDVYDIELSKDEVEKKKRIYRASISYLEKKIKQIIDEAPEDTVFVILGDHGELLGDYKKDGRKLLGHHFGTFKELVRVPFYIYPEQQNIEIDGLMDHTQMKDLIMGIAKDEEIKLGKETIRSEYFGKAGFDRNLLGKEPEKELFKRKSFSIINQEYKYDNTSDGDYLWETSLQTEVESLDLENIPENMKSISQIHYSWRFEDEN